MFLTRHRSPSRSRSPRNPARNVLSLPALGVPFLFLLCLLAIRLDSVLAASGPQAMNFTLEGKITELKEHKFTVNSEENMIFHVRYDDKTSIKRADGSSGSAKDLRVGMSVHVDGDLTESGEIVAQTVKIQAEPPPKK